MKSTSTPTTSTSAQSTATGTGSSRDFGSNSVRAATTASTTASSFPANTSLKYGDHGALVQLLQTLLTQKGFPVETTGNYLSKTTTAVRSFQEKNALLTDGVAGPKTLAKLTGTSTGSTASSSSSTGSSSTSTSGASSTSGALTGKPSLQQGSKGSQVELLQKKLNQFGAPVKVDGDFGAATDKWVRAFQRANSLLDDGVVGERTAAKLNSSSSKSISTADLSPSASTGSTTASSTYAQKGKIAADKALSQLGLPYVYATALPGKSFDCSGLTMWAWKQAGVTLPHNAEMQRGLTTSVSQKDALPGDLLFFQGSENEANNIDKAGHVAMYIGNGQEVQAPFTGSFVSTKSVSWGKVMKIGRVKVA